MAKYDDDFEEFDDDNLDDDEYSDDFEEETPRQKRKRQKAAAKARKRREKTAKKKHAKLDDYDDDDYDDGDIDDQAEELADDDGDDDDDYGADDDLDSDRDSRHDSFKDLIQGKGNTTKLLLKYFLPPVAGAVIGIIIGAVMFGGSSSSNQAAPTSSKGVQTVQTIQHAYSLSDIISSISHAQVNTLQKQLAEVSPNANGSDQDYTDDQFNDAKNAVSNINGMTKDVINPFFDKVLTMPVTQTNGRKATALDDAVKNTDKQASSSSANSKAASSSSSSSSSSSTAKNQADGDQVDSPVSKSVAQDKAAQIFTQESNRISNDSNQKTQIAGEILASGPANDLQQGGLKSGNAMAFEASASNKTFTYLVVVPYSTKTKTVNALFTMTIGTDKKIKSYHYVGYLNQINDQAKNFYNLIGK